MEEETPTNELKSLSSIFIPNSIRKSLSSLSSISLFSTIITLYALILLYFPSHFLNIVFSPIFISTGILLLALLRLGAIQRTNINSHSNRITAKESNIPIHPQQQKEAHGLGSDQKPFYPDSFREWNVRAPLEVIYEEYGEGEEEDDDNNEEDEDGVFNKKIERRVLGIDEKYPTSLSKYYPESDSDSDSSSEDWEFSEGAFLKWNEEDRGELIEIALDGKMKNCVDDDCQFGEEDNLIEIDIFPATGFPVRGRYS